jgi:Protein of unknown function (DUF3768)
MFRVLRSIVSRDAFHWLVFELGNDCVGRRGSIELAGQTYFFKLDYYAQNMDGGSEDPTDPAKTTRVLTIMRADEY